jgi:peptidoglycan/xylan/chitin deacetylase (PgdA/CDA1 family)
MKYILIPFIAGCLLSITTLFTPEPAKKEVAKKLEVPVLCYHRIRNILPNDGKNMRAYSVTPVHFAQQMKALHDNGYHTILPNQLHEYLVHNKSLPKNPVMITFDDTREEQYRLGASELSKYGFKGVFFIMTISINRPGYMTKTQIKTLSDNGNSIGVHTWDHTSVTKYKGTDWDIQVLKPKKQLESITGKPVNYFAYPSGIWNKAGIPKLKSNGYKLAFILSTKSDPNEPLYTIRRLIVDGSLSADGMLKTMKGTFNK